ncbi:glycosyltransferase [Novosphingobium taihuense]|uniref:Glycosyltransferase 2-like domain-containing protein n=1 Tax=Novosphingobium taihuense TaxID=260085 RepID=A0A7W7A9T7_9SPHN|nr:glycosyltransferase [Novosphingobium taihuense]MBB4612986.1 hypothetical protein [Novosphingobium taihuense]
MAMSVFNGARFLDAAIASVRRQTFADFEFLILDDGSTDGSVDIVRHHAAQDPRIRLIARENRGLIASLNELLGHARAPLFARMDADDVCRQDRLARQVAFLDAHPDHGVVGTWTEDIDEYDRPFRTSAPEHPVTCDEVLAVIEQRSPLSHPTVMARRDILRAVGGYHVAYRHCEDYDLWLRLASVTKLANIPERLLSYRHYANQISNRHAFAQQYGAAIAQLAYRERQLGRSDPTETLDRLPAVETLDSVFGTPGLSRQVRDKVARGALYSRDAMRGDGFALLIDHVRDGGNGRELWRTVVRLALFGVPGRAMRLAFALLFKV